MTENGLAEETVRRGHPKKVLTYCLRPLRLRSRLKPVVGRRFVMPGLCLSCSEVVFETQSSIELTPSAVFTPFPVGWFHVVTVNPDANVVSVEKKSDATTK